MTQFANEAQASKFSELGAELGPKVEALLPSMLPNISAKDRPGSLALMSLEIGFAAALCLGVQQPIIFYAIGRMVGRLLGQGTEETRDRAARLVNAGITAGLEEGRIALTPRGRA